MDLGGNGVPAAEMDLDGAGGGMEAAGRLNETAGGEMEAAGGDMEVAGGARVSPEVLDGNSAILGAVLSN